MTSKPVPSESNCYAALAKQSDSDSSTDETEISDAEQGAGLTTVPAASPHNDLPEPLKWELPAREPLRGNVSTGLAKQSTKTRKGEGSGKRPREVTLKDRASAGTPQQVVPRVGEREGEEHSLTDGQASERRGSHSLFDKNETDTGMPPVPQRDGHEIPDQCEYPQWDFPPITPPTGPDEETRPGQDNKKATRVEVISTQTITPVAATFMYQTLSIDRICDGSRLSIDCPPTIKHFSHCH